MLKLLGTNFGNSHIGHTLKKNLQHHHISYPNIPHPHMPRIHRPHGFLPHLIDQYINAKWIPYLFQCGLATLSLLIILLVGDSLMKGAIVVGVASSAFTVFVLPNSVAATPRKVIGGHIVAALVGAFIALLLNIPEVAAHTDNSRHIIDLAAALSVGLSIFAMVVTNTEHPPAAGTSLGLVIYGFDWSSIIFILTAALVLSILRIALRPKMINLL